jgi:hypothetical protein
MGFAPLTTVMSCGWGRFALGAIVSAIYADGFDDYTVLSDVWSAVTGSSAVNTNLSFVRTGTGSFVAANSDSVQMQCAAALEHATMIVGAAVYRTASGAQPYINFYSDSLATLHMQIVVNPNGAIAAYRAGTLLGTSDPGLVIVGGWSYIEAKVVLSDSVGAVTVRVNGAAVLTLTGQDTKSGGTKTVFDGISLQCVGGNLSYWDDVYWINGAGSVNNDFLGDRRVYTIYPNAEGTTQQWAATPSGTHYTTVDESPPNSGDYVASATNGQIELFGLQNLPANVSTVAFVQAMLNAEKTDAGTLFLKRVVRHAGTNYTGPSVALGTSYAYLKEGGKFLIFDSDPAGGAWDVADVNGLELGVQTSTT